MKKRNKTATLFTATGIILLLVLLSYFRDTFFRVINAQVEVAEGTREAFGIPGYMGFIETMEAGSLIYLKWFMTLAFTLLFMGLSLLTTWYFFVTRKFIVYTLFIYLFIFIISALSMVYGWLSGGSENAFSFSRTLMHGLQSPVLIMILFPAFYLYENYSNKGNSFS